ncbi:VSP [Hexamita inflata]|uniref:VSP n=1 Tax=Hexamita inflata TaxID=28002 RepID=A0AA86RUI9_9EUKA|nr:VSP [Hexamita inflata]
MRFPLFRTPAPYSDAGSASDGARSARRNSSFSANITHRLPDSVHASYTCLNANQRELQASVSALPRRHAYSHAASAATRCRPARISLQCLGAVCQDACLAFFNTNASNGNSPVRRSVPAPMVSWARSAVAHVSGLLLEKRRVRARCQTGASTDDGTNLTCGPACTGMYILNASNGDSQKCIAACPPETPYYEPGACQVKCTSGFYVLHPGAVQELVCAASCPIYLVNASNDNSKQCVSNCSDAAPYSDAGSCVGRCPTAAYSVVSGQQTLVCQDSCTFYVLNATNANSKQCLAACTDGMPYSHAGLCCDRCPTGAYSLQASVPVCQDACLAFFITNASNGNSRQCVDPCPPPMVSVGQECFGACSSGLPFLENSVCVARCQTGAYTDDGTNLNCGPACTGMYILNASNGDSQKCIAACPPETPYYEPGACQVKCTSGFYELHPAAVQKLVCAASCPIYLVNASNDNSKQCVSNCSDAAPYSDAGSCVGRCPTAAYSVVSGQQTLVCQDSCTFYVLNATNANSKQCLAACTDGMPYSHAGLCCDRCPTGAYSLQASVPVCQDACLAFFITNASNGNSRQCVDPCPPPMVSVGQECFGACSSGLPFLENAVCVARCQTGAYTDDGTNLNCGPACTGMYILNASNGDSQKCIAACPPETPYYEPGACQVKCTSGFYELHPAAVQKLVCAASCPIYLVNASNDNSKQCVSNCSDAAPYSDAGSCVGRCPTAAYSVVSGQQTLVCQDSCTFYVDPPTRNSQAVSRGLHDGNALFHAALCSNRCPTGAYSLQPRCG